MLSPFAFADKPVRATKACSDGSDNDGDGYIDWPNDPGCKNKADNSELNPNVECDDGVDNDGDNDIDYNDGGCSGPTDNDETNCGDAVCEGGETQGNCPEDCGYPDSCSDTDGGNVIMIFGTTSGYYNDEYYSDDDYCVDSGNIMEYYCSGDYEQSQQQSCGSDGYGSPYCSGNDIYKDYTDYYCLSGYCDSNTTPTFQEDCDSYDSYGSNYCLNSSVYRDFYNYYCTGGACDYTTNPELVEECEWGCAAGECDSPPDSCSETDNGFDIYIQGTTSGYLNEEYYSDIDYCLSNTTLVEYYCVGNYEYSDTIPCFNSTFCSNGTCV